MLLLNTCAILQKPFRRALAKRESAECDQGTADDVENARKLLHPKYDDLSVTLALTNLKEEWKIIFFNSVRTVGNYVTNQNGHGRELIDCQKCKVRYGNTGPSYIVGDASYICKYMLQMQIK